MPLWARAPLLFKCLLGSYDDALLNKYLIPWSAPLPHSFTKIHGFHLESFLSWDLSIHGLLYSSAPLVEASTSMTRT